MRDVVLIAVLVLFVVSLASTAYAQVEVHRWGEENPAITIAKATFWGGVTGLILGLATALVVDDNQEDIMKWFVVGGVFGGFGYGIYHVATREKPTSALLRIDGNGLALGVPAVEFSPAMAAEEGGWGGTVTLFAHGF